MGEDLYYDVFLSHKSEYKPWVIWLAEALQAQGRTVFLDIWNLKAGERGLDGLSRGVEKCRSAILVATPEVVNSGWVREEYNALFERRLSQAGFRLIPVIFGSFPNLPFLKNIQAVDCRDPNRYQEWLHRILCGLEDKEPGPPPYPSLAIPPPPALAPPKADAVVPGEEKFVHKLMNRVAGGSCPPILVASRGQRFQGPVIQAILRRAATGYEPSAILHLTPPFSDLTAEDCFSELVRQCGFAAKVDDATSFVAAIEKELARGGARFMLVTGFESAAALCRRELAGALRSLTERQTRLFRVVLLGGQRLLEQKFAAGDLSFLGHATVEEWPQPTVEDLLAWKLADFPALPLDRKRALELIEATGGHSGLLRHCLECWEAEGGGSSPSWGDWSYSCPELRETWHRLARNHDRQRLEELLNQERLGSAVAWPADTTIRGLYWADLLSNQDRQLVWRAEVVRQVGREVVA